MDFFNQSAIYTSLGFKVFPLLEQSKIAFTSNGVYDATNDETIIAKWSKQHPNANIAVGCGEASGICVVDVDKHHNGIETLNNLIKKHGGIPQCPKAQTPQGGYHLYFSYDPRIGNSVGSKTIGLGPGLDVKSKGGYVVLPPSQWNGFKKGKKVCDSGAYKWIRAPRGAVMPAIPQWMIDKLLPKKQKSLRPKQWDKSNTSLVEANKVLNYIDNGNYEVWIQIGMALKAEFGDAGLGLWDTWSSSGYGEYNSRECQSKWRSFKHVHSLTMGTIMHHAKLSGAPLTEILQRIKV